MMCSIWDNLH